ncbi:hypothetical protein HGRIS_005426 [Hohenbuehelia grisea]|uniref:Uncharacterized protein n=1 Tax=Hohenbuehelia grisea TaxID=104357 RepID=A0ABR3JYW2_9AGAR
MSHSGGDSAPPYYPVPPSRFFDVKSPMTEATKHASSIGILDHKKTLNFSSRTLLLLKTVMLIAIQWSLLQAASRSITPWSIPQAASPPIRIVTPTPQPIIRLTRPPSAPPRQQGQSS